MINVIEKWLFFAYHYVVRWDFSGEMSKFIVDYKCQVFSGVCVPKIIEIGLFLTELFQKIKSGAFLGHSVGYARVWLGGVSVCLWQSHTVTHWLVVIPQK